MPSTRSKASDAPRLRRRPATSCEPCRSRKLRCDRALPCGRCKRARKTINCFYREDSSGNQNRYSNNQLSPSDQASSHTSLRDDPPRLVLAPSALPTPSSQAPSDNYAEPLEARVQRLEALLAVRTDLRGVGGNIQFTNGVDPAQSYDASRAVPQLRSNPDKVRSFDRSHWMELGRILPTAIGGFDNTNVQFNLNDKDYNLSEVLETMRGLKRIRDKAKSRDTSFPNELRADIIDALPSEPTCRELVKSYLRTMQPIYRILHPPSFWTDYKSFWDDAEKDAARISFLVLFAVVIALGSTFYSGEDAIACRRKSFHLNHLAQSWLSGPLETTTANIAGLQIFCLLLLSKQTTLYCPGPAWLSAGSLLSAAMAMGLHRDPGHFPTLLPYECEMRRRLWAAVLELTMQGHIDAPAPFLVCPTDFDTQVPGNINDENIWPAMQKYPTVEVGITDASLQIQLAKSFEIRLTATRMLTGLNSGHTFEKAVELGDKMRSAGKHVCAFLGEATRTSSKVGDFHYHFVEILYHRYIMLLHQPFMIQSRTNPIYYLSRTTCFESASIIASYASKMTQPSVSEKYIDLFQLSAVGRASFKGPLGLHAILVLGLELTMLSNHGQAKPPQLDEIDHIRRTSRVRIVNWLNDIHSQLLEGLRFGSVNMKAVNFLAAFLAQIRAMDSGRPVKLEVYEALLSSLKTCKAILDETSATSSNMTSMPSAGDLVSDAIPQINFDALDDYLNWDISSFLDFSNFTKYFPD